MQLHPKSSESPVHSPTRSENAMLLTSMVPFKWEEVPGKPRTPATTPSGDKMILYDHGVALQLPPKLQFQGHQSPLFLQQSPYQSSSSLHHRNHDYSHQSSPLLLSRVSPITHEKLKSLYKYMHRAASRNQPCPTQSCGSSCASPSCQHQLTTTNERFFFDEASPQAFKFGVSMDAWKPHLPPLKDYKSHGAHKSLSFRAVEDQEAESTDSSPWHPIQFHDREVSESPYQSTSIKSFKELGGDGDEDHASFHDSFSTASSSFEKPSDRADADMEIACRLDGACPPSSAWFLDFSPEEETVHGGKGGSKLVSRFAALIKLKNVISRKVCKLRGRREEANDQQARYTSIWSPTLATYLYHNELREERETSSRSLHCLSLEDEDDDRHAELPSSLSVASSHGFHINPEYHLPSSILRSHLQIRNDFLESDDSSSFRVHGLGKSESPCFSGEDEEEGGEEGPHKLKTHRLSLREHLAEFDYDYLLQPAPTDQSSPQMLIDSNEREPTPCKGMCKARKTVKVLVATIKLILVQSEGGKRHGQRLPSLKYGRCLRPTLSTLSPFPSTHG